MRGRFAGRTDRGGSVFGCPESRYAERLVPGTLRVVANGVPFFVLFNCEGMFDDVPARTRRIGPWQGLGGGEIERLKLRYRLQIAEQGFAVIHQPLAAFFANSRPTTKGHDERPTARCAQAAALNIRGAPIIQNREQHHPKFVVSCGQHLTQLRRGAPK